MATDKRSKRAVIHDRWDMRTWDQIRKEMKGVDVATESLKEIIPETGWAAMGDTFDLFHKADPQLLDPEDIQDLYRVNRFVDEEMIDMPQAVELRRFTRGDRVAAAMATIKMEPELEILFDRFKEQQKQAEELQKLREKLQDLMQQLMQQQQPQQPSQPQDPGDGPPQSGGGGSTGAAGEGEDEQDGGGGSGEKESDLQDQIDATKQAIEAIQQALENGLSESSAEAQAQLQQALQGAVDEARDNLMASNMFGIDRGHLQRMNAEERIKLARHLNNPRIRQIAANFGPLRNLSFATKIRKVEGIPHEFMGIEVGNDLDKILAEQLAFLDDPDLEYAFLADYADEHLIQYQMQGTEHVGKGGIVLCEDGSGSMSGERELWAKAFMLVLLNIAKTEKREFNLLHFGSHSELKRFEFSDPSHFTIDNIVKAAEFFFSGGTDFERPLNDALKILESEHARTGRVESDIVFLTDGQCYLAPDWIEDFVERLNKIGGTCWGVLVGGEPKADPLFSVCEGKTCRLEDMTNKSKKEVRTIFQGLQRPEKKPAKGKR